MTNRADEIAVIRDLNDAFRRRAGVPPHGGPVEGRHVMTAGVAGLPPRDVAEILAKIRAFDTFTRDNDPYGEHDFGSFEHDGYTVLWKIDPYDLAYEYGSDDPADPARTRRVLTVMLAEEC